MTHFPGPLDPYRNHTTVNEAPPIVVEHQPGRIRDTIATQDTDDIDCCEQFKTFIVNLWNDFVDFIIQLFTCEESETDPDNTTSQGNVEPQSPLRNPGSDNLSSPTFLSTPQVPQNTTRIPIVTNISNNANSLSIPIPPKPTASTTPTEHKKIVDSYYNSTLKALENETAELSQKLSGIKSKPLAEQSTDEIVKIETRQKEINELYPKLRKEKLAYIRQHLSTFNPIKEMARQAQLKAGTILYCAKGLESLENCISRGVLPDVDTLQEFMSNNQQNNSADNFADNMFGKGLYFSLESPGYLGGTTPHVLICEVIEDIKGIESRPLVEYINDDSIDNQIVFEGWSDLQKTQSFIKHEGISANDTEIVIRNPEGKIRIVGVAVLPNKPSETFYANLPTSHRELLNRRGIFVESDYILPHFIRQNGVPVRNIAEVNRQENLHMLLKDLREIDEQSLVFLTLTEFCRFRNIQRSEQWKDISQIDDGRQDRMRLKINGQEVFFKKLRENSTPLTIQAEVGGSKLARKLIGELVPLATEMTFRGTKGISQTFKKIDDRRFDKVALDQYGNFDPTKLNRLQLEQLFAHMLADWVISNHDAHFAQFGLEEGTDHVIGIDKGEAYKFFKGTRVQSHAVVNGIGINRGPEANLANPKFYQVQQDPGYHVYPTLRHYMRQRRIVIDIDHSAIIQQTLTNISNLTLQDITASLSRYAKLAHPGNESAFYQDVLDRSQGLRGQVAEFKTLCS